MYAMNTDGGEYRYVNPEYGLDITEDILFVIKNPGMSLYEELDSTVVCDSVAVATDKTLCDEIPATLRIPATLVDYVTVDSLTNDSLVIPATEEKTIVVLPVTESVATDTINNK
jgi:hypothetical protein